MRVACCDESDGCRNLQKALAFLNVLDGDDFKHHGAIKHDGLDHVLKTLLKTERANSHGNTNRIRGRFDHNNSGYV